MPKSFAVLACALALFGGSIATAQKTAPAARPKAATPAADVPPISYVCPMEQDADVVEDKPGKCPKCGMTLIKARLASVWTCPVHAAVNEASEGKCPIDGRELVRVTKVLSWTCPGTTIDADSPGTCADGSAMAKKYTPRAHGNHNPQHGGQFFMDQDNWHHLEGTYPRAGVFRVYLYDDFTKPLRLSDVKKITAYAAPVVVLQNVDPATHASAPGQSFPLVMAPNGRYLEAKIGSAKLPASMQAKVTFSPTGRQSVFDFTFDKFSKEPAPVPAGTLVTPMPSTSPAAAATTPVITSGGESGGAATAVGPDPGLIPLPIPETVPEILSQLRTRTEQIKGFIDKGLFGDVYVPAFQAKDLAIALSSRLDALPAERRSGVEPAIAKLVRASYLLDAFGDIGNRNQIVAAFAQFNEAEQIIQSVFPR
jgi:hypothetical protein